MVVTASYDKGEPAVLALDNLTITPEVLTEGTTEVTISYTENGVTKTAVVPVTVNAEPEEPGTEPTDPTDPDTKPTDPQKPGTSDPSGDAGAGEGGAVQTGDTTNILPAAAACILAFAAAAGVVITKRRKRG